jgi:hypothetical protein
MKTNVTEQVVTTKTVHLELTEQEAMFLASFLRCHPARSWRNQGGIKFQFGELFGFFDTLYSALAPFADPTLEILTK